jgi:hypothetical protein
MPLDDSAVAQATDAGSLLPDTSQTVDTPAPAAEKVSIDDTIRNSLKAIQSRGVVTDENEAPDATQEVQQPAAQRTNSAGRLIDAQGRFIKKDGTVVATEAEADVAPAAEQPVEQKPVGQYAEAPKSWKKEAQAEWAKVPESLRAEIHRREEDMHKGIGHYKQFADIGQTLHKAILPYAETITKSGQLAPALIGDLLNMQKVMTTGQPQERVAMALQILQNTGLTVEQLAQAAQQAPTQPQADPNVTALLQKVQQLESRWTEQDRQRAEAEQADSAAEIERFRTDGKHEFFNEVALDMGALIEKGRAANLQEAYDKATWAHPDVRAKLQARQADELKRKQAEEAAAARKAAGANVVRRGTTPAPAKPGTIEDTIRQNLRRLNGGG